MRTGTGTPIRPPVTPCLVIRVMQILGLLMIFMGSGSGLAQDNQPHRIPLSIDGKPAGSGCVSVGSRPLDHSDIAASPMLRELAEIAAVLDTRTLARIRKSLADPVPINQKYEAIGYLTISRGATDLHNQLIELADGSFALRDTTDQELVRILDRDVLGVLGLGSPFFDGIVPKPVSGSSNTQSELINFPSPIVLDSRTRRVRFKHRYPELTRELSSEHFTFRLPQVDDSVEPPGVLIWISPTPNGRIPRIFSQACDQLNLIAVGVQNNGNRRELTDRLQNHFDSLATVGAYYRINHQRVYLTGMSGGGRCSSILQLAFPDVFMGAVPIVGLDSYHKAPTGNPGKYWPDRMGKPTGKQFRILKDRRIAAITGTMDFNAPEMQTRTQQMKADKINIRLDLIEGMGHTMPSSEQFLDAIGWVDKLQQDRIREINAQAQKSLSSLLDRAGPIIKKDRRARKILIQITIDAPWSDAAWEAARLLGIED